MAKNGNLENDTLIELLMQDGRWADAKNMIMDNGFYTKSEITLYIALLEMRRMGVSIVEEILADGAVELSEIKQLIQSRCDTFTAEWILQKYKGIRTFHDRFDLMVERA